MSCDNKPSSLAIIPARGGSKGLPRKNILPMLGKPLIAYTIKAARQAESINRIVVSTDDVETAEIATRFLAEVPFFRPPELAQDDATTLGVLQHVLSMLKSLENYEPDIVVLLQPTSPLRHAEDIDRAVTILRQTSADSVVSLCLVDHNPHWMSRLEADRVLPFLEKAPIYTRRQDLPPVYRINGAVYVTRPEIIMNQNRLLGEDTRGYIMDSESSIDIDTAFDMKVASLYMEERQNGALSYR